MTVTTPNRPTTRTDHRTEVEAAFGGVVDGGEQHGALGGEPGQAPGSGRRTCSGDARERRGQRDRVPVRVQHPVGRRARCAGSGRGAGSQGRARRRFGRTGLFGGVVPRAGRACGTGRACSCIRCARPARAGSPGRRRPRARSGSRRRAGRCPGPVPAEQSEHAGVRGGGPARAAQHRSQVDGQLADVERVQPGGGASRSSAASAASGRSGWVAARAATMPSASGRPAQLAQEWVDRLGFGGDPAAAERSVSRRRASSSGSTSIVSGRAPWAANSPVSWWRLVTSTVQVASAGQQRTHLGGVAGVVQHDEDPPAGHQAAVQRRPGVRDRPGSRPDGTPSASRNPRAPRPG